MSDQPVVIKNDTKLGDVMNNSGGDTTQEKEETTGKCKLKSNETKNIYETEKKNDIIKKENYHTCKKTSNNKNDNISKEVKGNKQKEINTITKCKTVIDTSVKSSTSASTHKNIYTNVITKTEKPKQVKKTISKSQSTIQKTNENIQNTKENIKNTNENIKETNENIKKTNENIKKTNEPEKSCFRCESTGNLVCCNNCKGQFHQHCLNKKYIPKKLCYRLFCASCKEPIGDVSSYTTEQTIKPITDTNKPIKIKKGKTQTEGSNYKGKINVGPNHQVQYLTPFFLDSSYPPRIYEDSEKCVLVYSPSMLENVCENYINEGKYDLAIKDDVEMAALIHRMAIIWEQKFTCHPFSVEYVYKILHQNNYNPHKAVEMLKSKDFDFLEVCDPPVRKYENKWRPTDKRGQISDSPHPSTDLLQSYFKQSMRRNCAEYRRLLEAEEVSRKFEKRRKRKLEKQACKNNEAQAPKK